MLDAGALDPHGMFPGECFPVGGSPQHLITGDLNGDGVLDLVTANYNSDNVSVLLGRGDGTFADQAVYAVGSRPQSVALGDLDGDEALDLVTANAAGDNVSVLLQVPRDEARAEVVAPYVFYNGSASDGNHPGPNAADDAAIAVDKQALLPGQTATFANYTGYSRGINGIMVDIVGLRKAVGWDASPTMDAAAHPGSGGTGVPP